MGKWHIIILHVPVSRLLMLTVNVYAVFHARFIYYGFCFHSHVLGIAEPE